MRRRAATKSSFSARGLSERLLDEIFCQGMHRSGNVGAVRKSGGLLLCGFAVRKQGAAVLQPSLAALAGLGGAGGEIADDAA